MSDLQCPARFLLVSEPDASMAEALRHERVAAVYDGATGSDVTGATGAGAVGAALGVPVQVMARSVSSADVLARDPETLGELRDLSDFHRGETVLGLAHGHPGQRVEVAIDADGVIVRQVSRGTVR